MKYSNYEVLTDSNMKDFMLKVNHYLEQGYELIGGFHKEPMAARYYQAVALPIKE